MAKKETMQELLEETIIEENEKLASLDVGEDRDHENKNFSELYKTYLEERKLEDELRINEERLQMEKEIQKKDLELKEAQIKAESKRTWIEAGKAGLALGGWFIMNLLVMDFEQTNVSPRSKAWQGNLPKLNIWK